VKVLFDHAHPFALAHGGLQIQIEETKFALERLGLNVEYVRWWDADQRGEIVHFFGRPPQMYIELAHKKGICVVMSELLTGLGSRCRPAIALQRLLISGAKKFVPTAFTAKLSWDAYQNADRIIALTEWEAHLMKTVFDAPHGRVVVVPNGVSEEFLKPSEPETARRNLVCTATITERKRVLELAHAAVEADVPLRFIGAPYSETDSYFIAFKNLVKGHEPHVKYLGAVSDRARLASIYRNAAGFVLWSEQESLSLSALEAIACGCPLLLSDLPWAKTVFGQTARYLPLRAPTRVAAAALHDFYAQCVSQSAPPAFKVLSWDEVGRRLITVYQSLLNMS
jgi:glycosyltransferase involved in cell wall biosynthesis